MNISLSISHIDTCLPCYLQDHHNREGEVLLQASVDGSTNYRQVHAALFDQWHNEAEVEIPEGYEVEQASAEIDAAFARALQEEFSTVTKWDAVFDPSLEMGNPDDGDSVHAYFLVTYSFGEKP